MTRKVMNVLLVWMLINAMLWGQSVKAAPEVHLIYTVDDWSQIRNDLSGHYRLMNDLDFNGVKQSPIGTEKQPFVGILDGNGFSLSNIQLEQTETTYLGLFGHAKHATFRDVHIRDTALELGEDVNLELFGGVLLGQGESVRLENIQIASSVSFAVTPLFKSTVGGLVGELNGTSVKPSYVINVSNSGKIVGKNKVGGLVGSAKYTEFESVTNTGTSTGGNSAGGIVGNLYQGKLSRAENEGVVEASSQVGGSVGYASQSVITEVVNRGLIRLNGSWGDAGGLVGAMMKTTLSDGTNTGTLEAKGSSTYVGGLVGEATQESIIRRGVNHSSIEVKGKVAGIVGTASQALIEQSYNEGDLSGSTSAGISGIMSDAIIRNSFNWGKVQGEVAAGGIVAYAYQTSKIETSYNSGHVKAYRSGALAGSYNGMMLGVYGVTHSTLIGEGEQQGTRLSPYDPIEGQQMSELSSSVWEFPSTHYPVLQQVESPFRNTLHPIAIKQIELKKTDYRQYEKVDVTDGQAVLNTNIGTTVTTALAANMVQSNETLESSGEQTVGFNVSGLSATVKVHVTPRYRALFMNHQNQQVDVQYVEPGQKANPITLPLREGYTLQGWTPELTALSRDQVYKPIYVKNTYWIRIMDGEHELEGMLLTHGDRLSTHLTPPMKANHLFIDVFEDQAFSKKVDLNQLVTKSTDLFAKFLPIPTVKDVRVTSKAGNVTVTWKGENHPTSYHVEVASSPHFTDTTRYTTSEEQYQLYLDPSRTYHIRVVPTLRIDNREWDGEASLAVQPALIQPLGTLTASAITSSSVTLSWEQRNYDKFDVYRSENQGSFRRVATVKSPTWTDTKLDYRKSYQYHIVGHLNIDETSSLIGDQGEALSVRLKWPYTKAWDVNPVSETSTTVTGRTYTSSGYVEVFKGTQRIGKMTAVQNGAYRVTIPKQVSGTNLTIKFYPHSMYEASTKQVVVKKTFPTLQVTPLASTDKIVTGKGKPGATVRAYVGTSPISKAVQIGKDGTFKLSITPQRGGRDVRVTMSQAGYIERTVNLKVLYVFNTFKVSTVKSSHTSISGNGNPGAKVQAFVGSRAISKSVTVNSKGTYRLTIPKQKAGTQIKLNMTKTGYKTQAKIIKVVR